ncbi:MAG: hypothetical protein M5T61_15000 [Acidimicrobiia bacterium]|nr:hypothetical protein [Acidimicrobiia bacterium]
MPRSRELRLLPRDALAKTRDLDQADWSYRPVLGWVSASAFAADLHRNTASSPPSSSKPSRVVRER